MSPAERGSSAAAGRDELGSAGRDQLSTAERDALAGSLRAQYAELLAQVGQLDRSLVDLRDARSSGDADDEHDPEGPTLSSEWSRMSGLDAAFRAQLAAIERALARVADGSYGVCVRCGRPIGVDRLEARPAAELCIACARLIGA